MPLNYSKWDQLELSDDSDIEGHPNVDKKSLIRWKQRDIHEKREIRKEKIKHLQAQIDCNNVLLPRIKDIHSNLINQSSSVSPTVYFNSLVEQLQTNPSRDCPPGNDPTKLEQTYDGMVLSLLKMVSDKAKEKAKQADVLEAEREARLAKELAAEVATHVQQLGDTIVKNQNELEDEIKEQKKHITSDDLHEGFASKYVPPLTAPQPLTKQGKKKSQVTEIELLNPKGVATSTTTPEEEEEEDDDEALPELTPALVAFSKISLGAYDKSFEYIQHHREVYVSGAADALLVAAFRAESQGKPKYARQCVHQSLLLQYCEKLGRDGVGVFFKKMVGGDKRAIKVFEDDVENTYQHLANRAKIAKEEEGQGREQIQLIPENPNQSINFNVPDGPPPEKLILEGPGTEDMDLEEVRKALQFRWDIFQGFTPELQEALRLGGLDGVNKILGELSIPEAENIVHSLDIAGILSFADGGIRDETGKGNVEPEQDL